MFCAITASWIVSPRPHALEQLFLGHQAVAVRDQVAQHVEHLAPQLDHLAVLRRSSQRSSSSSNASNFHTGPD